MTKKLVFLSLSLFFFNNKAELPSGQKGKYVEWCEKLNNLDTEQLRKMSRFLGDVDKEFLTEEKLQSYRDTFKGEAGYKMGQNQDIGALVFSSRGILLDPVLLKMVTQIISLAYLDASYVVSNESIQKLNIDTMLSESDEKEIFLSVKNSVKTCRLCIKSRLRDKKINVENKGN